MNTPFISPAVQYIGVDDLEIDLFEGQYAVPEGMAYNSFLLLDETVAVMDTVDARCAQAWFQNLDAALQGRTPDALVVLHVEPDHAGSIDAFLARYPQSSIYTSARAVQLLQQFFPELPLASRVHIIKEGDTLSLGTHTLRFLAAPMVHWPEVMVAYEESEHLLFSADAFGKFGALCHETGDWACEARRYYFNICGKYGAQVQALLQKVVALPEVRAILPLHGPLLQENLSYYLNLYHTWSLYEPESRGVFIAYASFHGHTAQAAQLLVQMLQERGVKVALNDLCRDDLAEGVEDAFRYDRMVLAAPTYDGGLMPAMEAFLHHLEAKTYRRRTVGLIENGSWSPQAAKKMQAHLEKMQDVHILQPVVTLRSALNATSRSELTALADALTQ